MTTYFKTSTHVRPFDLTRDNGIAQEAIDLCLGLEDFFKLLSRRSETLSLLIQQLQCQVSYGQHNNIVSQDSENLETVTDKIDAMLDLQLEILFRIQEMLLKLAFLVGQEGRATATRARL
ncbi:hypothetical protein BJX66DRAFT_334031 [Aspergillus keveii]|uniref:Uncharacterized protein n=1 Tax=Aspergillus keveii TaxID=714993 RepID=A0ABR4GHY0_9EURO